MKPEWLSAHLDGELDATERAEVEAALAADPALAAEYDALAEVRRVVRGGSWVNDQNIARSAFRNYDHPAYRDLINGLRVVVSASTLLDR